MNLYYILDEEHNPVAVSAEEYSKFLKNIHNRYVAEDFVDSIRISTVFSGLNCQWQEGKPPLIFETMVFGGEMDQDKISHSTWDEALAGHQVVVETVKATHQKN